MHMKKIIANIFTSSVYSSFVGSVVVFIGMMVTFVNDDWSVFGDAIGSAFLFYFITAISSCVLGLFIAGPVYVLLRSFKLANYFTSFCIGLVVTLACFGFSASIENLYWNLAGGVTGMLFHYHYINKPSWVG